jgi:thiosulfate dehydrogenase
VTSQTCSSIDGAAIYASKCASCHGALASSRVRGASVSAITGKHGTKYGTQAQMQAVADALK